MLCFPGYCPPKADFESLFPTESVISWVCSSNEINLVLELCGQVVTPDFLHSPEVLLLL